MRSERSRSVRVLGAVALFLGLATAADGQRYTEMYIPIGESPGLSGKHTFIGTVSAVDPKARTLTCTYGTETAAVRVTDRTRIWLDRSRSRLPSQKGSLADCLVGRRMEMRFVGDQRKAGAEVEWIKVEVAPGGK